MPPDSVIGYLGSKRSADVEAAKLALQIIEIQEGEENSIARKFGVDLLIKSTCVILSPDEYVQWTTGNTSIRGFVRSLEHCGRPVELPEQMLSDQQVEAFWMADRLELINCGDKVEVLSGRDVSAAQ